MCHAVIQSYKSFLKKNIKVFDSFIQNFLKSIFSENVRKHRFLTVFDKSVKNLFLTGWFEPVFTRRFKGQPGSQYNNMAK